MKTLRRSQAAVVLAMMFAVGASVAASRPAAPSAAAVKHMLFRIRGPHGATVYLLGSVHLLTPEAGKLPPEVDTAFAHAKLVAFETSLDSLQGRAMELAMLARNAPGTTMRSALTPAGAAKADTVLRSYGLSIDQLAPFKPWFATLLMTQLVIQKAKFQAQYGVDAQLNARAHEASKPTTGLESVDFQLHLFDSMTPAEQEEMLVMSTPPDSSTENLVKIKDAWLAGNTVMLDSILNKSMTEAPAIFDKIVVQRNKSWIPRIDSMLQGKDDALVVVGAAHLVGKQGVLEMLKSKGYTIEQM